MILPLPSKKAGKLQVYKTITAMTIEIKSKYAKLTADEDKVLTQLGAVEERNFAHSVCTKTPGQWTEWLISEMERWIDEYKGKEEGE